MDWCLQFLLNKDLLVDVFACLKAIWHVHFSERFSSKCIALLIKTILQELVEGEASNEVMAAWGEEHKELCRNLHSVECFHQFASSAASQQFLHLLERFLLHVSEPVPELLDLVGIIVALSAAKTLLVLEVVYVSEKIWNLSIAFSPSSHWTDCASQDRHSFEPCFCNELAQCAGKLAHLS